MCIRLLTDKNRRNLGNTNVENPEYRKLIWTMYEEIFSLADLVNQYLDLKGTPESIDFFSSINFLNTSECFFPQ